MSLVPCFFSSCVWSPLRFVCQRRDAPPSTKGAVCASCLPPGIKAFRVKDMGARRRSRVKTGIVKRLQADATHVQRSIAHRQVKIHGPLRCHGRERVPWRDSLIRVVTDRSQEVKKRLHAVPKKNTKRALSGGWLRGLYYHAAKEAGGTDGCMAPFKASGHKEESFDVSSLAGFEGTTQGNGRKRMVRHGRGYLLRFGPATLVFFRPVCLVTPSLRFSIALRAHDPPGSPSPSLLFPRTL